MVCKVGSRGAGLLERSVRVGISLSLCVGALFQSEMSIA